MPRIKLHWQILIALVLAVVTGLLIRQLPEASSEGAVSAFDFVGRLFLNLLGMIVLPLIMSSIVMGIAGIGTPGHLGRLGGKTIAYYALTSLIAIIVGLAMVNLLTPGIIDEEPARDRLGLAVDTGEVLERVGDRGVGDVAEIFVRMVPTNIFAAAAEGNMLAMIFFSIVLGIFMTRLPGEVGERFLSFWKGFYEVMMLITGWVIRLAPYGVFALVARTVAITGVDAFRPLLTFFFTALLALGIHMFVVMPLVLLLLARVNPLSHFKAMAPALLTAFSTASSSATLPLTMRCVEKRAGVSNRTSSFVLPLGATVNMDGTALYECVAAMFIAQAYGLELTLAVQFTIVLVALLTSIGVAGIPAASLVAIVIILQAIGLPAEGIGLILAVDRVLDMMRTGVNIFGDSVGAVVIGRSEGETEILRGDLASEV